MVVANIDGDSIMVTVPLRYKTLIEQVPGRRYHAASKAYRVPLSWAACIQLRAVFGQELKVGSELSAWAAQQRKQVDQAAASREDALIPDRVVPAPNPNLRPFQTTGVAFLRAAGSAILADDLGTGKTVQSLAAVEAWPLLVVTTKSCKLQWVGEIATWTAAEEIQATGNTAAERRKAIEAVAAASAAGKKAALVINWDQLASHSRLAPYGSIALTAKESSPKELNAVRWGTVIADEAHKAKCPKTKWTRALWALGDRARDRFALTGTPVEQSPLDFWALLRFVSPREWPTKTGFVDRYCLQDYNPFGGLSVTKLQPAHADEFHMLKDLRFLRRPKALVAPWLPKLQHLVREVEMSTKQKKAYKEMTAQFVAELENGGELAALNPLTRASRLAQLTAAMMEETGVDKDGNPTYHLIEPSPKLDELQEILAELDGAPVVIAAASRQLLRLLEARLVDKGTPYGIIAGDIPEAARALARDDYNAGRVPVLLLSLGAGAEGLNLTRGSTMIFLDRAWSFVQNTQTEGRLHGIGRGDQDAEAITIIDLVVPHTVDGGRYNLIQTKGETMEHIVRDKLSLKALVKGELG